MLITQYSYAQPEDKQVSSSAGYKRGQGCQLVVACMHTANPKTLSILT